MRVRLTDRDAGEIEHKLSVLADTPELLESYGLTDDEVLELSRSIPRKGGVWIVPWWGVAALRDEIANHCAILRDAARDDIDKHLRPAELRYVRRLSKLFQP